MRVRCECGERGQLLNGPSPSAHPRLPIGQLPWYQLAYFSAALFKTSFKNIVYLGINFQKYIMI